MNLKTRKDGGKEFESRRSRPKEGHTEQAKVDFEWGHLVFGAATFFNQYFVSQVRTSAIFFTDEINPGNLKLRNCLASFFWVHLHKESPFSLRGS